MKPTLLGLIPASLLFSFAICAPAPAQAPKPDAGDWVSIREKMPPNVTSCDMIAVDPTTGNLYLYSKAGKLEISLEDR